MDVDEIQQADRFGDGVATEFVRRPKSTLVPSGQVAEERGRIVLT
jgi:hypothetical protein